MHGFKPRPGSDCSVALAVGGRACGPFTSIFDGSNPSSRTYHCSTSCSPGESKFQDQMAPAAVVASVVAVVVAAAVISRCMHLIDLYELFACFSLNT